MTLKVVSLELTGADLRLRKLKEIKGQLMSLDPEYFTLLIDRYIKKYTKAINVNRAFLDLKSNIEFSDVVIAESTSGKMSVFGGYSYKGESEIDIAYFSVKFLNESGELIGKDEVSLGSDFFEGVKGSIGFAIKDSYVASLAKSVILEPSRVLVF